MSRIPSAADQDADLTDPVPARKWWIPYLAAWAVFLSGEYVTWSHHSQPPAPVDWLIGTDDKLVSFILLLSAPLLWWLSGTPVMRQGAVFQGLTRHLAALLNLVSRTTNRSRTRPACYSLLVAGVSLAASLGVGARFDGLPPAYHDEYSYLFQAETFLAGRASYPSHDGARLFDQMHVLNEGRFASRYFPGTGIWMAPFVAAGHPYWGHWLANVVCAVLMFWIGRELAGDTGGLIAGLLTACSPGMALFSNLLLAHHPTLVGLGVFLLGVLRLIRSAGAGWALASGVGLAFAMLCRPMTAAGIALPFGAYLLWWAVKEPHRSPIGPPPLS